MPETEPAEVKPLADPAPGDTFWTALARAASLAPSGDNVQPWSFHVDSRGRTFVIGLDEEADRSPMNGPQLASRFACGAAVENAVSALEAWRIPFSVRVRTDPWGVCLRIGGPEPRRSGWAIPGAVLNRCTNRRPYSGQAIDRKTVKRLKDLPLHTMAGLTCRWVFDSGDISEFAEQEAAAMARLYAIREVRAAIMRQIHPGSPRTGMPEKALELPGLQLRAFRLLSEWPTPLLRGVGFFSLLRTQVQGLIRSSSGLFVAEIEDGTDEVDYGFGRTVQRAWLALTHLGFAVQPHSCMYALRNIAASGEDAEATGPRRSRWPPASTGHVRPRVLLRFGSAPPPSARTARWHPELHGARQG